MIRVEDRERIRRAYFIEHKSMRQIARELRHGRDTVKKAIESAEPATYTLKKPRRAPVLGPYRARIDELLAQNERLPRKQRYTGHKIYEDIQSRGYQGSESRVRSYIAQRRRGKKKRKVYLPLEFDPGIDSQVDWGEAIVKATRALRHAAGNFYINDKPTGAVVGQQPFGGGRASGTNDKAGSQINLMKWTSVRSIKEAFCPPKNFSYPHMLEQ